MQRENHYLGEQWVGSEIAGLQEEFESFALRFHIKLAEVVHTLHIEHDALDCVICQD